MLTVSACNLKQRHLETSKLNIKPKQSEAKTIYIISECDQGLFDVTHEMEYKR